MWQFLLPLELFQVVNNKAQLLGISCALLLLLTMALIARDCLHGTLWWLQCLLFHICRATVPHTYCVLLFDLKALKRLFQICNSSLCWVLEEQTKWDCKQVDGQEGNKKEDSKSYWIPPILPLNLDVVSMTGSCELSMKIKKKKQLRRIRYL